MKKSKTIYSKEQEELSAKLVEAREEAGLTQVKAAQLLKIPQSDISKMENGQKRLEFLLLLRMAKLYKKPLDFFVPSKFK